MYHYILIHTQKKNHSMAIVIERYCIKRGQKALYSIFTNLVYIQNIFINPYEHIKTLNSLKLTFNRNNFVSINSC